MSLVRVQSEEPNLRSLLSSRLFAFLILDTSSVPDVHSRSGFEHFTSMIHQISLPYGKISSQNGFQSGQYFIHDSLWYSFQALAVSRVHINDSGLAAANPSRFRSRTVQ